MISIETPTASRTASTVAMPSSNWRGSTRSLIARNPSSLKASTDSARSPGGFNSPQEA